MDDYNPTGTATEYVSREKAGHEVVLQPYVLIDTAADNHTFSCVSLFLAGENSWRPMSSVPRAARIRSLSPALQAVHPFICLPSSHN